MELQTNVQAAIVAPIGSKVTDRRMSAVHQATSNVSLSIIAASGGKVGKEAAMRNVGSAVLGLHERCANSDYRPLAEIISAATGKVTTIDRFAFHALPGRFADDMADLESRGKAGIEGKPSAAYKLAAHLHKLCADAVRESERIRAERKAAQEAEKAARALDEQIRVEMDRLDAIDAEIDGETAEA
jgi:hypothetical protein